MSDEMKHTDKAVYAKISKVMGDTEAVAKSGYNEDQHYAYVQESEIVATIRKAMVKNNLVIIPVITKRTDIESKTKNGYPMSIVKLEITFTIVDADSGERIEIPWLGDGQDTGDKALYKAITGATKYFLLKTFLIPTNDDPEKDSDERGKQAPHPSAPRPPMSASPSPSKEQIRQDMKMTCSEVGCGANITNAEGLYSMKRYGRHLCRTHQAPAEQARKDAASSNASGSQ